MNPRKSSLTIEEIVKIHEFMVKGFDAKKIISAMSLKKSKVYYTIKSIGEYIKGRKDIRLASDTWKSAMNIITKNDIMPKANGFIPPPQFIEKPQDNLLKLEQAFITFQQVIVDVIDSEVQKRSEGRVRELKEKYEKQLQDMQAVLIEAQNSSVIGLLKKKWGQE